MLSKSCLAFNPDLLIPAFVTCRGITHQVDVQMSSSRLCTAVWAF